LQYSRVSALLANSFSYIGDSDFEIHFFDGDKELFHFIPTPSVVDSFAQENMFTVFDRTWQVPLAPAEEFVNETSCYLMLSNIKIFKSQHPTLILRRVNKTQR